MAVRYQQAAVCMGMGSNDQAEKYLNEALAIYQLNEVQRGNKGESAHVKWRLSQILVGREEMRDVEALQIDAEQTKLELEKTGEYAKQTGEDAWDVFLGLLYR
jgi:hypothetical protein